MTQRVRYGVILNMVFLMIFVLLHGMPVSAGGVVGNGTPQSCTESAYFTAATTGGTVTFNCGPNPVTIAQISGALNVGQDTTIDGDGLITLSGAGTNRLFDVNPGATLTLNNIILTNGYSGSGSGGAVYVIDASLVLNNSTIQNSRMNGFSGGAISAEGGNLTLVNSVVQGNSGFSGAIFSTGAVTLTNSVVWNNTAIGNVGVMELGGRVTINNSQIYSNTATADGAKGGAIYAISSGQVTISGSQISNNRASGPLGRGGAIYSQGALTITQSTLSGNFASGYGGGIYHNNIVTLINSTLSGNSATGSGGGISNAQ